RVLVVLPTSSYRTGDFVAAASALGVDLAVASEENPPLDLGDRFVRIDCKHPRESAAAIVALADHSPIDAVVAADDAGVMIAALAAEKLALPHHPPAAGAATRDKLEMRRLLADAEVPQPAFAAVGDDPAPAAEELGYPLVVKPRTASASEGVLRVDDPVGLVPTVERVRRIARDREESGPLLAEAYVPGTEVAVEGMMAGGELTVLATFDKPDTPSGPTFEETVLVTPSSLPRHLLVEVDRVVGAGVRALGLSHGPVHAEARIDPAGRVHLLEIAARSIGGLCARSLRFGLAGISLEEVILATALGRTPPTNRQPRPSGVSMLPIPTAGVLRAVAGVEEAGEVEGITEVDITIPPGTAVEPLPEGDRYLGFVFGVGSTPGEVVDRLHRAVARLRVRIE
ncbi:MAG TPA: ATP-grasp domain-containing protein, partial [Longimicrobiales bacterium]|nr:ATP-grasp domain-containing protein [Longimicrobiales bacterium]